MKIFFEKSLIYSVIAVYLFITVAPLVWVLSTSFKPNQEAISFPPKFLPDHPTLENYFFVLTDSKLVLSLINSLIVSVGSTALRVTVSALGGYAFASYDFK
jgi:multiple sugar transport system permease protein